MDRREDRKKALSHSPTKVVVIKATPGLLQPDSVFILT